MSALIDQLHAICDEQPFTTSWYLKDLATDSSADRRGHIVVPSASTRKVAILMAALEQVAAGRRRLDEPVTIEAKYQHNDSGCFQHLQPGFTLPLRDLLIMMIIVSDNTSTGTVAELVGLENINALCSRLGMRGTTHRHTIPPADLATDHPVEATNATTPADMGLLLELVLRGAEDGTIGLRLGSSPELCQLALDILSWQKFNGRMPFLLPRRARVAHKTGTGARGLHDAGIVFDERRPLFILTVYTDGVPTELPDGQPGTAAATLTIARLARACWDHVHD